MDMRMAQTNIHDSMEMKMEKIGVNNLQTDNTEHTKSLNFTLMNDCYAANKFLYSINGAEVPLHVHGRVGRTFLNNKLVF
ncbi:hypothetical protein AYI69_g738 [Smittium culicis]|uniref:Uncharacterized protein n=1 Tax=Smittium culicis TaxID=133412 RepID=A0A1R1YS92_9FUNG|nr:hypothetical protein AYI69_g738 [Smittium culicis]